MPPKQILKPELFVNENKFFEHIIFQRFAKLHWVWISVYAAITIVGLVGSYFVSEWWSVGLSFAVAASTFYIGFKLVTKGIIFGSHKIEV